MLKFFRLGDDTAPEDRHLIVRAGHGVADAVSATAEEVWENSSSIGDDVQDVWSANKHIFLAGLTAAMVARYTGRRIARTENTIIPGAYAAFVAYRSSAPLWRLMLTAATLGVMWGLSDTFFLALAGEHVRNPTPAPTPAPAPSVSGWYHY
jgi:hypothetical protein